MPKYQVRMNATNVSQSTKTTPNLARGRVSRRGFVAESANDRLGFGSIGASVGANRFIGQGEHPGRGAVIRHQAGQKGDLLAVADAKLRYDEFFAERDSGMCEVHQTTEL